MRFQKAFPSPISYRAECPSASGARFLQEDMRNAVMKGRGTMEPRDYTVTKIEGEYAYLREESGASDTELFIALALLPSGTDVGSRLHYEMLEYTLLS